MRSYPWPIALSWALLALPALAQQGPEPAPPPPPLDLGPLLRQARESQAMGRVLGDRFFLMTSPRGEALMRVRVVAVEDDPPTLAYDSLMRALDKPGAVSTQILLGWDGKMQAFRSGVHGAGVESVTEGKVLGKQLKVTSHTKGKQPTEQTLDWHDAAIPAPIAMFVLPSLIDQGIPKEGALFMQFDERGCRYGARRVVGLQADNSRGPGLNQVHVTMPAPPHTAQFTAHLSPAGHITALLRGGGQNMRIVLVSPKVAEKLMDRVVDFIPDPSPSPEPGSGAGSGDDGAGEGEEDSGADAPQPGSGADDSSD